MRSGVRLLGLLLALVLGPAALLVATGAPARAATTTVLGELSIDAVPRVGAPVDLLRWSGTDWINAGSVTTTAGGAFAFDSPTVGVAHTLTSHGHYPDGSRQLPSGPGAPGTFVPSSGVVTVRDLRLTAPPGVATGRVLRDDGTPAAGAFVELYTYSAQDDLELRFSTEAGSDGSYDLPLYDVGRPHTVLALADAHVPTFLGSVNDQAAARRFDLPGGPLGDLTLLASRLGGRVVGIDGRPVAGLPVRLERRDFRASQWVQVAATASGADGRYRFVRPAEGTYSVVVSSARGDVRRAVGLLPPDVPEPGGFGNGAGYRRVSANAIIDDHDVVLPPAVVGPVVLSGSPVVGQVLQAETGSWSDGYALSHQWTRDGVPIPGAVGSGYRLTAADARRTIAVMLTATTTYPGAGAGTTSSAAVTIRAGSRLRLALTPRRGAVVVRVRLGVDAVAAARTKGRVVVLVDGRRRAVATVKRGAATLVVKRLSAGRHRVVVRFAGDSLTASAQSTRSVRTR